MPFATLSPSIPHSRSFFRRSGFFSGGEGCEWRAPRATVGESGDKAENEFSGFIPLAVPRKGFSPHIPASRLFVLFHPTGYYKIKKQTPILLMGGIDVCYDGFLPWELACWN